MGKRDIKSDPVVGSDSDEEPKQKKSKVDKKSSDGDFTKTSDGTYASLSPLRRVTVKQYRKVTQIDLREFYTDKESGEDKPGKKGISLTVEQWEKLKTLMPQIDAEIEKLHG